MPEAPTATALDPSSAATAVSCPDPAAEVVHVPDAVPMAEPIPSACAIRTMALSLFDPNVKLQTLAPVSVSAVVPGSTVPSVYAVVAVQLFVKLTALGTLAVTVTGAVAPPAGRAATAAAA